MFHELTNADRAATAETAVTAAVQSPHEAFREPRPSVKAGRAAANAYAALTRFNHWEQRVRGAGQVGEVVSDLVGDILHWTSTAWGLYAPRVVELHRVRVSPFRDSADYHFWAAPWAARLPVFAVGNLLALANAYGIPDSEVLGRAMDHFQAERAEEATA